MGEMQKNVGEGSFTVINVGNDGEISDQLGRHRSNELPPDYLALVFLVDLAAFFTADLATVFFLAAGFGLATATAG